MRRRGGCDVASGGRDAPSFGTGEIDDGQLLLTVREAATVLAIGRTTLYELIGDGQLRTVRIGRAVRVPRAELEAFVERRCQTGGVR